MPQRSFDAFARTAIQLCVPGKAAPDSTAEDMPQGKTDDAQTTGAVLVPLAVSELIDKITILEIKTERIGDPARQQNIASELRMLAGVRDAHIARDVEIERL